MNTKKLIGTIIGVIAFAAIIAGATYAWLTTSATVTNDGIRNGYARNFTFQYAGSTLVSNPRQLGSSVTKADVTSESSAATAGDGWVAVTASKAANSAAAGTFRLKLKITTNSFYTNSVIYVVCKGNCPETTLATVTHTTASRPVATATCGTGAGIVACGTLGYGSTDPVTLYDDTSTFASVGTAVSATYNVYFWIDGGTLHNDDKGKVFAGYIYAEAAQDASALS